MLKMSKPWPYRIAKRGLLPYYKIETAVRFKKSDIKAFLEKSRVEARKKKESNKNKACSSEPKHTTEDTAHSSEAQQTAGVCLGCFKRADGKADYLIDGFCETCRPHGL
jgi:excisionase family DNA binding protein